MVIHHSEWVEEQTVEEKGEHAWSRSKRKRVPGYQVDAYFRATVLPRGSFSKAQERDTAAEARADPARKREAAVERARCNRLASARQRWLLGGSATAEELGLER